MRSSGRVAVIALVLGAAAAAVAGSSGARRAGLPVDRIQSVLQDRGTVTNGVLDVPVDREDIGTVHINGVPIKPSFEVNGDLTFQPLGGGRVFFNGDIALRPSEVNAVINAVVENNLQFQAEHQHFYDFEPDVWFVHFRGTGPAVTVPTRCTTCSR